MVEYEEGRTQVLFYKSPLPINAAIAVHTWIEVSHDDNSLDRWEVWEFADVEEPCWGHLHKNLLEPGQGMGIVPFTAAFCWDGSVIETVHGETAERMVSLLQDPEEYPFTDEYHYVPGPNSNTFTQWVIDQADVDVELPWNAFGKGYV